MSKLQESLFKNQDKTYNKKLTNTVNHIRQIEHRYSKFDDIQLKDEFKSLLTDIQTNVKSINTAMPNVFALISVAANRTLNMTPYDVQIKGAIALHEGNVAEMKTGEGKTLTATMPIILNAMSGKGVHVVTVNEYLAKRDVTLLSPLYNFFNLSIGLNLNNMTAYDKRIAYQSDIMYSTANELGFDYLRDNMVKDADERVSQRPRNFALIDEVDSILIDEAKTPLIIAQMSAPALKDYIQADQFVTTLKDDDYEIDLESKSVHLTKNGEIKANSYFKKESVYDAKNTSIMHRINQALQAQLIQKLDVDYAIIQNPENPNNKDIVIIDQFTGRIMPGRRFNNGLHQALEAKHVKDGVVIQDETVTTATITLQNFFRLYNKISGMSGTAKTEEEEFSEIYNMRVIPIETNKPLARIDYNLELYSTKEGKWNEIVNRIKIINKKKQPILVGTSSVEDSELLSKRLKAEKIEHVVLNAKQDEHEAQIIALAGNQSAITIATNMAGRGTDIKLGENVKELGGLFVLSTELNDSRRIDDQLKGRAGRQGDPGATLTIASLQDNLFQRFGSQSIQDKLIASWPKDKPLTLNKTIIKSLLDAQKRVEGSNYDSRKSTLQYDDIVREQRTIYYSDRNIVVNAKTVDKLIPHIKKVTLAIEQNPDLRDKSQWLNWKDHHNNKSLTDVTLDTLDKMPETIALETIKAIILSAMDASWIDHIDALDKLKSGISYRSYSGTNPVIAYQTEAAELYDDLINSVYKTEGQNYLRLQSYKHQERSDVYDNQFSKSIKGSKTKSMKNFVRTLH